MSETSKFVSWWRENPEKAEAIKERRKQKRQTPEGREKARVAKAAYRAKKRGSSRRFPKPKPVHIDDQLVLCWSVGQTAEFLGVANSTLSWLEREGKIPTNHLVDSRRRRWWPEPFVRWLKPFFEARRNKEISSREFVARVWEGWEQESSLPDMRKVSHA